MRQGITRKNMRISDVSIFFIPKFWSEPGVEGILAGQQS